LKRGSYWRKARWGKRKKGNPPLLRKKASTPRERNNLRLRRGTSVRRGNGEPTNNFLGEDREGRTRKFSEKNVYTLKRRGTFTSRKHRTLLSRTFAWIIFFQTCKGPFFQPSAGKRTGRQVVDRLKGSGKSDEPWGCRIKLEGHKPSPEQTKSTDITRKRLKLK